MRSKSVFASKTLWLNLIGAAVTLLAVLPIDPDTLVYILSGLNIATRVITTGPVHVLKDAASED